MRLHFANSVWFVAAFLLVMSLTLGVTFAHEGRPVGEYRLVVGWLVEPAYEGSDNAVSIRVNKATESGDKERAPSMSHEEKEKEESESEGHHGNGDSNGDSDNSSQAPASGSSTSIAGMAGQHGEPATPVEGLEETLQVEVTHVPTGTATTRDLLAVFGDPGHYVAAMIPTATGVYEFRVFGTVEGTPIDETFASMGGGGGFDDIRSSAGLQFPVQLPEIREIESGARGALAAAQEAQDTALAAQTAANEAQGGGNSLAILALIIGVAGAILGAGGVLIGLRGRGS